MKNFILSAVVLLTICAGFTAKAQVTQQGSKPGQVVTAVPYGNWLVKSMIYQSKMTDYPGTSTTMIFDPKSNKVNGQSFCNTYSATYEITDKLIKFGPMAMSKKLCSSPYSLYEQAFIANMVKVTSYLVKGNMLYLYSGQQQILIMSKQGTN